PQPRRMPRHSVREYGAAGDGETLDTAAIQDAVDAAAAEGGGTVVLPAGTYRSKPVFLASDVEFHLEAGATLLGDDAITEYPVVDGRWNGIEGPVYASLLTAHDRENVAITGRGTIDASGRPWWDAVAADHELFGELGFGREDCFPAPPEANLTYPRPNAVHLQGCTDVLLRDVTVRNSPFWAIHPVYCENVTVDGVTVRNPADSPNTDGINPDSCTNVHVSNCHVDVGDDCVTIKSGYDADGRRVGEPCENVTVTNCTMYHGHGGVVVGSEMSGDVRNVTISNCVFDGTDNGLRLKTERGRGGVIENVRATNLVMRDIPNIALLTNMFYHGADPEPRPVTEETPRIRGIHYSDITVDGADTLAAMRGLPEMPLAEVSITDVRARNVRRGVDASRLDDVALRNVVVDAGDTPAVRLERADDVELARVADPGPDPDVPVVSLEDVDAVLRDCTAAEGTGTFCAHELSRVRTNGNELGDAERGVVDLD
ncbi:MAG: glycoside hydrolase family 28 protein, partial [Halobacteriaceae archaeon]